MKPIIIEVNKWHELLDQLHNDYPKSVLAIKSKTQKVLGFTSRLHRQWVPNENYDKEYVEYERDLFVFPPEKGRMKEVVHLDFYDEVKRTFFILKYSEFLK